MLQLEAGAVRPGGPLVDGDTLYDVASLTKVISTATAAWLLVSRRELHLDDPVSRFFPTVEGPTTRHLLAHTSGLPAWRPLFLDVMGRLDKGAGGFGAGADAGRDASGFEPRGEIDRSAGAFEAARQRVVEAVSRTPLEAPPGQRCTYSDLGFILLGEIVSRVSGNPLDRFFLEEIATPLGLGDTSYRRLPSSPPERAVAPTGVTRPREPAPGQESFFEGVALETIDAPGEVDDDNAWAMGGVAGHAGLFSTASDVARWGAAILRAEAGDATLGDPSLLRAFLQPDPHPEGPRRALGFDLPTGPSSTAGSLLGQKGPKGAAGHLGFTGCSIWLDFDRGLSVSLLTNRVYPTRKNESGIRSLRPVFHDAVIRWWDGRFTG